MLAKTSETSLASVLLCLINWSCKVLAATSFPSFNWSAVESSSDLEWHACYSPSTIKGFLQQPLRPATSNSRSFSCARLSLPLDYHDTSNPHNVSVPILRITFKHSPTHRGTIFMGLGGAGNSRVQDFVPITQSGFLEILDPDFEYDFLTFDNRGFGYSFPSARCFESVLDSTIWEQRMNDLGGYMSSWESDDTFEARIAAASAKSELCSKRDEDVDIRRHMTSAYAARDMLEILNRLPRPLKSAEDPAAVKNSGLKYIGASYGTLVGQTFASLYPQYVSRMVLDGAVNGKDWVAKWQMSHLIETDAVWASIWDDCFEARQKCPLWRPLDDKAKNIEDRITEFLEDLKRRPVYTVRYGHAKLMTYREVKLAMYWTTMAPALAAESIAKILDGFMRGYTNVTLGFPFQSALTASSILLEETAENRAASNADAGTAVNCGDAEDITNSSISDFRTYLSALEEQRSVAAFFQGERKIRCLGWSIKPAWRFVGPFSTKTEDGRSKLSTPILFMGNKLDPMTSLHGMRSTAEGFLGSVVLVENARGHCVFGNPAPSNCAMNHLRSYLRDGSVPDYGTSCGSDCNVFDGSCFKGRRALNESWYYRV